MSDEILTMIGIGVALGGYMWLATSRLDRKIDGLAEQMSGLRERVARLEGAVETLTNFLIDRERPAAGERP